MPIAVTTAAVIAIGNIFAAKVAPEPPPWASSTSRLVRFEPGRKSEEALAMKTQP